MQKCLLISTKDQKFFFTQLKNKKQLAECCKAFGAKMSVVRAKIDKKQLLDLPNLVIALCDKNYKNKNIEYKTINK